MFSASDIAEQFEMLLAGAKQSWLLGAGVSYDANVPLMYPLTERVFQLAFGEAFAGDDEAIGAIKYIQSQIGENDHIEVFLTQLGDYISLAERSREKKAALGPSVLHKTKLTSIHLKLLELISHTVRWGYRPTSVDADGEAVPEKVGDVGKSIVTVDDHMDFVRSIFNSRRAGLEVVRARLEFFSTNYDTLLEDALALSQIEYCDGFSGGGIGFWNPRRFSSDANVRANVTKLHGSIDWYRSSEAPSPLVRIRSGDCYPPAGGAVMIFPQATKYQNSQQNPFLELFGRFRRRLSDGKDHVLLTCGYSFGDDHINADIEVAMSDPRSQLVLVSFVSEGANGLPPVLDAWRQHAAWGERVYVASPRGLYRGNVGPVFSLAEGQRDWWTFKGVTKLLNSGLPTDIQAAIQ